MVVFDSGFLESRIRTRFGYKTMLDRFFSIGKLVIFDFLDEYPFLDYLPIGALDGATEVGPSFT